MAPRAAATASVIIAFIDNPIEIFLDFIWPLFLRMKHAPIL